MLNYATSGNKKKEIMGGLGLWCLTPLLKKRIKNIAKLMLNVKKCVL
jgi:hypothetical protein